MPNWISTLAGRVWNFTLSPIASIIGPNATPRDKLLFAIGTTAILWYFLSITCIAFNLIPLPAKGTEGTTSGMELRQFMSFSVTTISGTLATYLGMVLGFGQKAGQPAAAPVPGAPPAAPIIQISNLQKVAAWAYFFSLIYALALWGFAPDTQPKVDIVITTLGQSILGLFGGALAVILNVE
jgi:hypothetical protein